MATSKYGTSKADNLKANANVQSLYGGTLASSLTNTGNDTLSSGVFTGISLYGGDGNDTLIAKDGDTLINGGTGTDTVQFAGSVGAHVDSWLVNV